MLDKISPELSKRILAMLLFDGLSMAGIAKEAGTTVAFLRRVAAGDAALKPKHLENLDDAHPGLPFRIGRDLVKENVADLAKKSGKVAKQIRKSGEAAVDSVGHKLRHGAWALLNRTLDDDS